MIMIKVAIVDDHEMVLTGLQHMLSAQKGIKLCGLYINGISLLEGLKQVVPDVLLLDLQLPDMQGEELAAQVLDRCPSIRILIVTSIDAIPRVKKTMQIGCRGYSLKNISPESLTHAIRTIYEGGEYLDPLIREELLKETLYQNRSRSAAGTPNITRREMEILKLLLQGNSSKDIAGKLFLSTRTVDNHRKSLLYKFNVKNSNGLVKAAMDMGIS